MRLLLYILFLFPVQLLSDEYRQVLVDNCEKRPVGLFYHLKKIEDNALRGDVEAILSSNEIHARARDEFGCTEKAFEELRTWSQQVLRVGWESEIRPQLTKVEAKLHRTVPMKGYFELREARDVIARFSSKLGKNIGDFIDVQEVEKYINEGIEEDLQTLRDEISEQSKYRNPTELFNKLSVLALRENREDLLFPAYQKSKMIDRGLSAEVDRKQSCTNVNNLREPLRYDNARSQDDIGWCFAFTGADMVAHKLGVMVSPIDMALNHNNAWLPGRINKIKSREGDSIIFNRETDLEGGFPGFAISETMKKGFCPESVLPEKAKFARDHHDYIGVMRKLEDFYQGVHSGDTVDGCMDSELQINCGALFPNLPIGSLLEIVANSSRSEFLDKVIDENCKGHRINLAGDMKVHNVMHMLPFPRKHLWNKLDEQLEKGNIASMVYSDGVLHDNRDFTDPFIDGHHVSIVAGRRFNETTKTCEYLIRNSHGDWCAGYDPAFECHTGHLWVGEQYLNRSLQTISYLE